MTEDALSWQHLPAEMAVNPMPKRFATEAGAADVWLWLRYPMMCLAVDLDPDSAELLGHGLIEAAKNVRARLDALGETPV